MEGGGERGRGREGLIGRWKEGGRGGEGGRASLVGGRRGERGRGREGLIGRWREGGI